METSLSPSQREAYEGLRKALEHSQVCVVWTRTGLGRTTLLRAAQREYGGAFLSAREYVEAMEGRHPLEIEETYYRLVRDAVAAHETVIVDDLHLVEALVSCHHFYPRHGWFPVPLAALMAQVAESDGRLLVGSEGSVAGPVSRRAQYAGVKEFTAEDYGFLCRAYLDDGLAGRLDYEKIHRFAPKLNGHQIRGACEALAAETGLDTERFMEYLRSQRMASNVDLGEVQAVDLRDLKGVDDVIESLEANIILPLENDDLAQELAIKPKRGVLLAGPAGTGKTTIGRALAHRLRSKFFLIDGTFISGTRGFYERIHEVFERAKENAPAVIFIDDSDVIFESGEEMGLYRYLLTMLDGLESESAGRVCVMMTAMDVGNLPPAMVRSGRIELWLETRLPDEEARREILLQHLAGLPPAIGTVDAARLASATEGLTGADLKRLVEDGKILYGYDRARGLPSRPATDYFLAAVETVLANKERYAAAEARARLQRPSRPPWFPGFAMPDFAVDGEE